MAKNPLFNLLGGGASMPSNVSGLLSRFQQFRQNFKGDPRQQIQQMLNSGQISQADYDKAVKLANEFMQMMK